MVVAGIVAVSAAIAALLYWGTRSAPNDVAISFDAITGTGGGAVDFIDPQRGIVGPSEADIERFGGD